MDYAELFSNMVAVGFLCALVVWLGWVFANGFRNGD